MSTENIYNAVLKVVGKRFPENDKEFHHLDIGAGQGELIGKLRASFKVNSQACDFHTERFPLKSIPIKKINLNSDELPYDHESFDLVTCSEVIEHVENYHSLVRDASRVLKKGGLFILTTPNVLNMKSRIRYFFSGFTNLFGPLPFKHEECYSTDGHITPVPYFYLVHALKDASFGKIHIDVDKYQRSSLFLLGISFPFLILGWIIFFLSERYKFRTLTDQNNPYVQAHFSFKVLTGRTLVVSAVKED